LNFTIFVVGIFKDDGELNLESSTLEKREEKKTKTKLMKSIKFL